MLLILSNKNLNDCSLFIQGEWLCLNCQTQRALSGNLGDMGQIPRPLSTSVTESAALPNKQTSKISDDVQGIETPEYTVLKPTGEEQIAVSNVQPVESVAAAPASIETTDNTSIKAADKTDKWKPVLQESTVRQEKLTTEIAHTAEMLQIQSEIPPTEAVFTTFKLKSEIVQQMVSTKDEPTQAVDSPNIIKPPTVEASLEFKETLELTSMVMYKTHFPILKLIKFIT